MTSHCIDCDRPWVISGRCREHHYRLRGYSGMEGKHGNELPADLTSMSVKWMHTRIEKFRIERANAELNAQTRE